MSSLQTYQADESWKPELPRNRCGHCARIIGTRMKDVASHNGRYHKGKKIAPINALGFAHAPYFANYDYEVDSDDDADRRVSTRSMLACYQPYEMSRHKRKAITWACYILFKNHKKVPEDFHRFGQLAMDLFYAIHRRGPILPKRTTDEEEDMLRNIYWGEVAPTEIVPSLPIHDWVHSYYRRSSASQANTVNFTKLRLIDRGAHDFLCRRSQGLRQGRNIGKVQTMWTMSKPGLIEDCYHRYVCFEQHKEGQQRYGMLTFQRKSFYPSLRKERK